MARTQTSAAMLAVVLGWVGGNVDAIGFLLLAQLFIAHMSGNSAALGAYLGQGQWAEAMHRLTPIPLFIFGIVLGAAVIEVAVRRRVRCALSVALLLEALLILGFRLYASRYLHAGTISASAGWPFDLLVALLAVPMGIQTAALQRVGSGTVHTTYITGMLTSLAREGTAYLFWLHDRGQGENASASQGIVPARPSPFRALLMAGIYGAYLLGAAIGGYTLLHWSLNALAVPLLVLASVMALDLRRPLY